MDGYIFPDVVSRTNPDPAIYRGIKADCLRVCSDDTTGADAAVPAQMDSPQQMNMRADVAAALDHCAAIDDGIGSDLDILSDLGLRIDHCSCVCLHDR